MFDINAAQSAPSQPDKDLAKAYPAQNLAAPQPGWVCNACGKRNAIHDPFCKHCEDGQ